jgi:hypothetical protein
MIVLPAGLRSSCLGAASFSDQTSVVLHVCHGETLLQVVDIDICGTTTVK